MSPPPASDAEEQPTLLPIHFARPSIDETDVEGVAAVLRSGWLTSGDQCVQLEAELAEVLGAPHVVAMASCTAALEAALAVLRLRPGARVGIPVWTFVSTALAAVRAGAKPVLLDVDRDTLNIDPVAVAAAIQAGLEALVLVHFGGVPVNPEVRAICAAANVPVIEDCAHSFGATDDRGPMSAVGSVAGCFSFYATKNLAAGEGGALVTQDAEVAEFARSFRQHGMTTDAWRRYRPDGTPFYDLHMAGIKGNLSDVHASLARTQLRRFDSFQARRREIVAAYRAELAGCRGLRFAPSAAHPGSAEHLAVVVLPPSVERGAVIGAMAASNIGSSVHFRPLHHFDWFRANADLPFGAPAADELAPSVLSLPLGPMMTVDDVARVVRVVRTAVGG